MDKKGREKQIKSIIKLEERIGRCERCSELIRCTSRPSLGKGDLEPEVVLVFECESYQTLDIKWVIELRNTIRKHFRIDRIYHTFMVRCHPKSCVSKQGNNFCLTGKLLNQNNICLLNNQVCDGISIRPSTEEIINCIYFLVEEIAILKPQYVILFGSRVEDFLLKSFGIFDSPEHPQVHKYESTTILTTVENKICRDEDIQRLTEIAPII